MPKIFEDFVVKALRECKILQTLGANNKSFPQNRPLRFDTNGRIFLENS